LSSGGAVAVLFCPHAVRITADTPRKRKKRTICYTVRSSYHLYDYHNPYTGDDATDGD